MRNITLLLIKFISGIIAFAIGLDLFFDATIIDILSFSLALTAISYLIGDRIILPRFGNREALIADFVMTYLLVWIFGSVLLNSYVQIGWGSILSALIVTISEVFVHRSLLNQISVEQRTREDDLSPNLAYGTEFADEPDIHEHKVREENGQDEKNSAE